MENKKTNVMRSLDQKNISYISHSCDINDGKIDAISIANKLNRNLEDIYKTLVAENNKRYYIYVIPSNSELDYKKAAKSVGEKRVKLAPIDQLVGLTGYVRGGCSPIGLKKKMPIIIDYTCRNKESIIISGGKPGSQIEINTGKLITLTNATVSDII